VVQAGEECDDGNQSNDDACPDDVLGGGSCQDARCGDGFVYAGAGETCDDGNGIDTDDCPDGTLGTCAPASCSDGLWHHDGSGDEVEADCGGSCGSCTRALLLSEVVTGPPNAELVEIYNPSAVEVSLENVYLADYADYYLLTEGGGTPGADDFRVSFPAGATVSAGGRVVVAVGSATSFDSVYGQMPDYDLDDADAGAPAMEGNIGSSAALGGNEMLVLFTWDGASDLVQDVDYLVWGDTSEAMDKSNVTVGASTYLQETPVAMQSAAASPPSNQALSRCLLGEGVEVSAGGNGLGGSDETSEDHANTWIEVPPTPGSSNGCPVVAAVTPLAPVLSYVERVGYTQIEEVPIVSDEFNIVGAVAMAQDPTTGAVYAVLKDENTLRRFARINIATGAAQVIGQPMQALSALAYTPTGELYAMTGDGAPMLEDFVAVDTGDVSLTTMLGLQTGACCGEAMALNPADGLFYRFSGLMAPILQSIDPAGPTALDITLSGASPQEVTGAFWDPGAGHFVVFDNALSVMTVETDGTTTDTGITLTRKLRGGLIP
jgi:hypothetical protein